METIDWDDFARVELRVGSGGSGIAHSFIGSSSVMADMACEEAPFAAPDMGLAPGGRMRQEIYDDPFSLDDWDHENASRCFVHLTNSMVWPVNSALSRNISFLMTWNCSAWMAMSAALPVTPPSGWCIRMRACGSA